MLKKLLYTILFFALAAGSFYAYQQVGFARKTAMFFQVILGNETARGKDLLRVRAATADREATGGPAEIFHWAM